jgi:hypothetical protein
MSSNDLESQYRAPAVVRGPLAFHLSENMDSTKASLRADTTLLHAEKSATPCQPSKRSLRSRVRRLYRRLVIDWWSFEITCLVISVACIIIISLVLSIYDGKPLPKWSINISINGFLSMLSALAKSTLILATIEGIGQLKWSWFRNNPHKLSDFELFHLATRGSWGAAMFLIRIGSV